MKRLTVTLILLSLSMCLVHAQLSSNPNKFLGNITTGGSVNGGGIEAVPGHQPAPYREALGGEGVTGYDWIIKGANCNIDKITFNCVVPSDIEAPAIDDEGDICDVYTPDGIHVGEFALQSPLTLGSQLRAVTGERGIFIVRHRATGVATRHFVRE